MIKYNNNTINDWNFGDDNIIKVYKHGAVCYYKITSGDTPTPVQEPCFAVVDDITQYSDTEFEDVYDKATEKWYKLNNLNQYEEYGIYGSGRTITYYDGKLTIDTETPPSRLPQGYTEVEYVENTSTAYIDSGFKPNQDTRIVLTAQCVTSSSYGRYFGAGGYNTANAMQFDYESGAQGTLHISWGHIAGWTIYSSCVGDYNVHTYDWDKNYFYRDKGETNQFSASTTYTAFQCVANLGIFCHINDNGTAASSQGECMVGKMYSFQIYDNGTLVRDFVPCKRDSDDKYGMYDIVNNAFYVSPNNVNFSGGEPIVPTKTYEYIYSGGSWVNLGEVSGGTATLPDVPFTLNYNAKNYDASTHTIPYTEGALNAIDAVITGTTANIIDHHEDGYIQLTGSSSTKIRALVGTTNFSRSSSSPNITIICKAYTPGSSTEGNILSNRKESYNWMYRHKSTQLRFHGQSEQGSIAVSNTEPNTCSVRIDSNRLLTYNNWTQNTTSTYSNFNYGSNSNGGALFSGYYTTSSEMWKGVFYWIYMSLNTLTDEQVQQVINYNEGGATPTEYPKYYDEIQDPPDNLVFSSMAEAEAYECPWVGMKATIAGDKYVFSGDSISGYEWVYQPPIACEYNFCGVDANGNDVIINNGTTTLTQSNWTSPYPVDGIVGAATTTIGMYCFNVISGALTALTIGNTVTRIEHEAFMEVSLLTTLTIPSSVTQIDFWAFTRCYGLNEVIFEGTTPPMFTNQHDGVFHDYCPPVIYVPDSAVSAYRAIAGSVWTNQTWSTSIIQPISNRT